MSVRPAKTQISLGIRPVWLESSLCALWGAKDPSFLHVDREDFIRIGGRPGWSESSLVAHSFCWFCHVAAHIFSRTRENNMKLEQSPPGPCTYLHVLECYIARTLWNTITPSCYLLVFVAILYPLRFGPENACAMSRLPYTCISSQPLTLCFYL